MPSLTAISTLESDTQMTECIFPEIMDDQALSSIRPNSCLRAPNPSKFVRKQRKSESTQIHQGHLANEEFKDRAENFQDTVEIDRGADLWTFANQQNFFERSTKSNFYTAHRHYVTDELTKPDISFTTSYLNTDNDVWDGFLRILSL